MYKYSTHLTPGPAGGESYAAFLFSCLAGVGGCLWSGPGVAAWGHGPTILTVLHAPEAP
jgi:hypothetical protein